MKKLFIMIFSTVIVGYSCSTQYYVIDNKYQSISFSDSVYVIRNDSSFIFPVGIHPRFDIIDQFVFAKHFRFVKIDSIICEELIKQKIPCKVVNNPKDVCIDCYCINYQDYWSWDFKGYMHILKIYLSKSNKTVITVISQGNTSGLHDFPNPSKQVPVLINLILRDKK